MTSDQDTPSSIPSMDPTSQPLSTPPPSLPAQPDESSSSVIILASESTPAFPPTEEEARLSLGNLNLEPLRPKKLLPIIPASTLLQPQAVHLLPAEVNAKALETATTPHGCADDHKTTSKFTETLEKIMTEIHHIPISQNPLYTPATPIHTPVAFGKEHVVPPPEISFSRKMCEVCHKIHDVPDDDLEDREAFDMHRFECTIPKSKEKLVKDVWLESETEEPCPQCVVEGIVDGYGCVGCTPCVLCRRIGFIGVNVGLLAMIL
ncbi:hypothetical protein VTL71DRAFT_9211 [Oculimacula yallundae]|uniref:Uncharacterized protein n=1 Tax=Oculimacula yallundae TaxID=86028 RepID=A0ABR4BSI9_9HELO